MSVEEDMDIEGKRDVEMKSDPIVALSRKRIRDATTPPKQDPHPLDDSPPFIPTQKKNRVKAPLQCVRAGNSAYEKVESWKDIYTQVGNMQSMFDALALYQSRLVQQNSNEKDKLRAKLTELKMAFAETKAQAEARSNVLQAIYNKLAQHAIPTIDLLDSQYTQSAIDVEVVLNFIRDSQCAPAQTLADAEALLLEYRRDVYMLETTHVSTENANAASQDYEWERVSLPETESNAFSDTNEDDDIDSAKVDDAESLAHATMGRLMKIARRYSSKRAETEEEVHKQHSENEEDQHRAFVRASMEQLQRVLRVKEKWIALRSKIAFLRSLCLETLTKNLMSAVSKYTLKSDVELPSEFNYVFVHLSSFADIQQLYQVKRNDVLSKMHTLMENVLATVHGVYEVEQRLKQATWPASFQFPDAGMLGMPNSYEYAARVAEELPHVDYYMPPTSFRQFSSLPVSTCNLSPIVFSHYQRFGGKLMGPDSPQQSLLACAEPAAGKTYMAALALFAYILKRAEEYEQESLLRTFSTTPMQNLENNTTNQLKSIHNHLILLETNEQVLHFVQHLQTVINQSKEQHITLHDPDISQTFKSFTKLYEVRLTRLGESTVLARILFQSYFASVHRVVIQRYALNTCMQNLTKSMVTGVSVFGDATTSKFGMPPVHENVVAAAVKLLHDVLENNTWFLIPTNETVIIVDDAHNLTYLQGRTPNEQYNAALWCLLLRSKRGKVDSFDLSHPHALNAVPAHQNVAQKLLLLTGTPLYDTNVLPFFRLASLLINASRDYYYQVYPKWNVQPKATSQLPESAGETGVQNYFRASHTSVTSSWSLDPELKQMFLQIHAGMISYFTLQNDATKFPTTRTLCSVVSAKQNSSSNPTRAMMAAAVDSACVYEYANKTLKESSTPPLATSILTGDVVRIIIKKEAFSNEANMTDMKNDVILNIIKSNMQNDKSCKHFVFFEVESSAFEFLNDSNTQALIHPFSEWVLYQMVLLIYLYDPNQNQYPPGWPERWFDLPADVLASIIWHSTLSVPTPEVENKMKQEFGATTARLALTTTPISVVEYMCIVYGTNGFVCLHRLFETDVLLKKPNNFKFTRGDARNMAMRITKVKNFAHAYSIFGAFEHIFRTNTSTALQINFATEANIPRDHLNRGQPLPSSFLPFLPDSDKNPEAGATFTKPLTDEYTTFFMSRALALYNSRWNTQARMPVVLGNLKSASDVEFRNTQITHFYSPPSSLILKKRVAARTARACAFDNEDTETWWNMLVSYEHDGDVQFPLKRAALSDQIMELLQLGAMDRMYFAHYNKGTDVDQSADSFDGINTRQYACDVYSDDENKPRYIRIARAAPLHDSLFGLPDKSVLLEKDYQRAIEATSRKFKQRQKKFNTSVDLFLNAYLQDIKQSTFGVDAQVSLQSVQFILETRCVGVSTFAWRANVSELEQKMKTLTQSDARALHDFIANLPDDVEHLHDNRVAALLDTYGDQVNHYQAAKNTAVTQKTELTNALLA
jgi:hypothetical protein